MNNLTKNYTLKYLQNKSSKNTVLITFGSTMLEGGWTIQQLLT